MGIKSVIFVVFLSMVAYHIFNVVQWFKFREAVFNHEPGPCKVVKLRNPNCANAHAQDKDCEDWAGRGECQANPVWMAEKCAKSCAQCEDPDQTLLGSEDFADLGDGKYLISSGLQFLKEHFPGRKRGFYLFDFNKPNDGAIPVKVLWDAEKMKVINPHGIAVYRTKEGKVFLFVVNHAEDEVIERFEYNAKANTLKHLETISDSQFTFLNSVAPTGERSFYFSNLAKFNKNPLSTIEGLLMLHFGNIGYYDADSAKKVASGFFMANGLDMSLDKKYLYMAVSGDMTIETFRILDDYDLEHVHTLELNTLVDNVQVDPATGDLWIGAAVQNFKAFMYMEHPADPELTSSSRVLQIKTEGGIPTYDIKDVYTDDGGIIKMASAAATYNKQLLIGSIYDTAVYCKIVHV